MTDEQTVDAEEFGAPPPDPFDGEGEPIPDESGAEDGTPLPPDDGDEIRTELARREAEEIAAQKKEEGTTNAGKRFVLAANHELGPYSPLSREPEGEEEPRPALFEGDDRTARLAALEEFESVRMAAQGGTLWLVTVPAGSWKPRQPKPPKPGWVV